MGRIAHLFPVLLLSAAVSTAAERGYLPAVGPAPLRFAAPRPAEPSPVPLPPLQPSAATPAPSTNTSSALAGAPGKNPEKTGAGAPSTNSPSTSLGTAGAGASGGDHGAVKTNVVAGATQKGVLPRPTDDGGAPTPAEQQILAGPSVIQGIMPQPQLFLQYFTPDYISGTNGSGVLVPVGFIPPQPRAGGSSSATYQTTPPTKP